jgi:tRNA nucleotidyltransferase (CCA-adding enzyme)
MMRNYFKIASNIDPEALRVIRKIGRETDKRGIPAYLVGGIVRDALLGKENLDVDIVLEKDAVAFARALAGILRAGVRVYPLFGTASLELPSGGRVDLATARKEEYPHPGALPQVKPGCLRDDLFRRDFTINAMALSINRARFGELIDDFGGLMDLRHKRVRVLHDKSFIDDPTRILRAVRFEQRFGFRMEEKTLKFLKEALRGGAWASVKPPRYFAELKKIFLEPDPCPALRRLKDLDGLRFLMSPRQITKVPRTLAPGAPPAPSVNFGLIKKVRYFEHSTSGKLHPGYSRWLVYFMVLAEGLRDADLEDLFKRYPLTKEERRNILQSRGSSDLMKQLSSRGIARSGVYQLLAPLGREAVMYVRLKAGQGLIRRRIDRYLKKDCFVRTVIGGEDLKRLGFSSGERMGEVLENILFMKVDGKVGNKKDELKAAKALLF